MRSRALRNFERLAIIFAATAFTLWNQPFPVIPQLGGAFSPKTPRSSRLGEAAPPKTEALPIPSRGAEAGTGTGHTAFLETARLQVVVADNEAYGSLHRAGYNGVSELRLRGEHTSLFVPLYAGLNLEHFFSGDAASFDWNIFEPRRAAMRLVRVSTNRVELLQERTEHWPIRSRLVYEAREDGIDFTYYGTPLEDLWKKHGYVGVFFASYINAPEDLAIHFIGRSRPGKGEPSPRWIRHLPPSHGVASSHRPAGSNWDPPADKGFNLTLVEGVSDFEYVYPFYFGRFGENVFLMMFEEPRAGAELRFAQSPTGGGKGNPAWDFAWFQRDYAVNREFRFRARAVYRKFVSLEDIVHTYERWSGKTVSELGK